MPPGFAADARGLCDPRQRDSVLDRLLYGCRELVARLSARGLGVTKGGSGAPDTVKWLHPLTLGALELGGNPY